VPKITKPPLHKNEHGLPFPGRPFFITRVHLETLDGLDDVFICDRENAVKNSSGGLSVGIMHHQAQIICGDLRIMDNEGGGTSVICNIPCDVLEKKEQCNNEH
jgi:hypothetical protein